MTKPNVPLDPSKGSSNNPEGQPNTSNESMKSSDSADKSGPNSDGSVSANTQTSQTIQVLQSDGDNSKDTAATSQPEKQDVTSANDAREELNGTKEDSQPSKSNFLAYVTLVVFTPVLLTACIVIVIKKKGERNNLGIIKTSNGSKYYYVRTQ